MRSIVVLGFIGLALAGPAMAPALAQAPNPLTIELDADSTEADGASGVIRFTGVHIRQGDMSIRANLAESSSLDFEDSSWSFRGRVEFRSATTRVTADTATLTFRSQQLTGVELTGKPLVFEQQLDGQTKLTGNDARLEFGGGALQRAHFNGDPVKYELMTAARATSSRADRIEFDAAAGVVTLDGNAWIGEAGREITGDHIMYNFRQQSVIAASDDGGRVKITITPKEKDSGDGEPVAEPETTQQP